jgi:hypothetical protein
MIFVPEELRSSGTFLMDKEKSPAANAAGLGCIQLRAEITAA